MDIGTINLATQALSKVSSSYAAETQCVFCYPTLRIVADIEFKFKLISLTMRNESLLNLKSTTLIDTLVSKVTSMLDGLGVEFDPAVDPFGPMVAKKAMTADEVVHSMGPDRYRSVEVALLPEFILKAAKYEFFKKLRSTHPEKFTQPEAEFTAYSKEHGLALRLTSNARLTDEQRAARNKGKQKREANFDLLRKFTSDPDSINF